jgi:uncharacterized iron-regulated membrane protein
MRLLFLVHRYLGIAVGVLMVAWCVSGAVMMYVRYPQLSSGERLRHLEPLDWGRCCVVREGSLADDKPPASDKPIEEFQVEMVARVPVARVRYVDGKTRLIDLADGHDIGSVSAQEAEDVAASFGKRSDRLSRPRLEGLIDYDQWTVSGEFNRARPLFRIALADGVGTRVYVSAVTGRVMQVTTALERFWNWLGAIPHWLYFAQLRRNAALWGQVVIWTSLIGCFLAFTGLWLGIRQLLRQSQRNAPPYRGILFWHHLPGLIFGLFALAWVVSGFVSMNPWGFLDADADAGRLAAQQLRGTLLSASQVQASLGSLSAVAKLPGIVSVESTLLDSRLYLVVTTQDGGRWRFNGAGVSDRIDGGDWIRIARLLGGNERTEPKVLTEGDEYYFDRHGTETLPVYRIIANDRQQTRYYLDPLTGALLASFDGDARWYRWLHQGVHTLDFTPVLRARPSWDVLMLLLLGGATTVCATGTYLAIRRISRPLRRPVVPQNL